MDIEVIDNFSKKMIRSIKYQRNKFDSFRILLLLANSILCLVPHFWEAGLISLLLFVLFFISLLKSDVRILIKFFPPLVNIILAVIAVAIIDYTEPYLPELTKQSLFVGAVPLFVQYYLIFVYVLEIFDNFFLRKNNPEPWNYRWGNIRVTRRIIILSASFLLFLISIMFIHVLPRKPFFLLKIDRFRYRALYITGIWVKFEKYFIYGIPVLLMNWRIGNKKISLMAFFVFIIYYLWQGEKYSVFMGTMLFILLYIASDNKSIRYVKKLLPKLISIVIILIILILLQYRILYQGAYLGRFSNRIAQQGQLWWSIYGDFKEKVPNFTEITDELDAYKENDIPRSFGIYKIMYLSAPEEIVTNKIKSGATYTESTPSSLYYYFGGIGLLFHGILYGFLFALLGNYYVNCIKSNWIIESLLLTKTISDFREMIGMSRFSVFFSSSNLSKWMIIIICILIRHLYYVKNIKYKKDN